jgi:hypothetical protein
VVVAKVTRRRSCEEEAGRCRLWWKVMLLQKVVARSRGEEDARGGDVVVVGVILVGGAKGLSSIEDVE